MECYAFVICTTLLCVIFLAVQGVICLSGRRYGCRARACSRRDMYPTPYILFIIHHSSFIQAACRALTPSVTRCARATSLKREAIWGSRYVRCRRCDKMLKTRFTRKCRCVDLTTRCEENTHLMRQKVNEMRQNRCKDAKIWRTRCEETAHNKIDII